MYSRRPLHIDEQMLDDQLEHIFSSSVPIQDEALKTCRERWTIETGNKKESWKSMQAARADIYIYIYIYIYMNFYS